MKILGALSRYLSSYVASPTTLIKAADAANQVGHKAGVSSDGWVGNEKLLPAELKARMQISGSVAAAAAERFKRTGDPSDLLAHTAHVSASLAYYHCLSQLKGPEADALKKSASLPNLVRHPAPQPVRRSRTEGSLFTRDESVRPLARVPQFPANDPSDAL